MANPAAITRGALIISGLYAAPGVAAAEDRVALGYMVSRPIADSGTGLAQGVAMRWDRMVTPWLEVGGGIELGFSGGEQPLQRLALLPGIALVTRVGGVALRLEQQGGWQIVRGRLTLDGIPLRGIETRSFHDEIAVAVDAPVSETIEIRVRAGIQIDGIYPVGHASLRVGPFVGFAVIVSP